jgi:hypothetical protein
LTYEDSEGNIKTVTDLHLAAAATVSRPRPRPRRRCAAGGTCVCGQPLTNNLTNPPCAPPFLDSYSQSQAKA